MKIIWLGQSGLLFVSGKKKIIVDPYLSDSLHKFDKRMFRGMKPNRKFFRLKPDIIILTNAHPDHTDIATIASYIHKAKNPVALLCCENSFYKIEEADIAGRYNMIMFEEGSEWTLENLRIAAVPAKTDDKSAIGVVISDFDTNKKYYVAGDTLYNRHVIETLPENIDTAFIPINGEDGCMNLTDAARFAKATGAGTVVPVHFGMFDNINPKELNVSNKIIPKIYKILNFELDNPKHSACKKSRELDANFEETDIIPAVSECGDALCGENIDTDKTIPKKANSDGLFVSNEKSEEENTSKPHFDGINRSNEIGQTLCESDSFCENAGESPFVCNAEDEFIENEKFNIKKSDSLFGSRGNVNLVENDNTVSDTESFSSYESNHAFTENQADIRSCEENNFSLNPQANSNTEKGKDIYYENLKNLDNELYGENETEIYDDDFDEDNISDKIDAYIKELEKFERGDTVDFEKIDS